MIVNGDVDFMGKTTPNCWNSKGTLKFPGVGRKVADCIMLFHEKVRCLSYDCGLRIIEHIYFGEREISISLYEVAEEA